MVKKRFSLHHLLPGISLVFTLFVFAPIDLYLAFQEELWFPLTCLLRWLFVFGAVSFIIITLLSAFLPQKLSVAFRSAVYACSFLAYLQGNLLILDYGELDGRAVNWSDYTLPYILDALLWIIVITVFIFLMFRFRKKFRHILEVAACVLLITQVVSMSYLLIRHPGKQDEDTNAYLSTAGEFIYSPERNVSVLVLDSFDSNFFEELRQKNPDFINQTLEDFTFYYDTVGGATRTKYAIPFILTGTTNKEEQSYVQYLSSSFRSSPLIQELSTGKYDSGLYVYHQFADLTRTDAFRNIENGTSVPTSRFRIARHFMNLVAFRYAPSALSRFFWIYTGDFDQWKHNVGSNEAFSTSNMIFYKYITSNSKRKGFRVSAEKPCFRMYHLNGVHPPYKLNENIQSVPPEECSEEQQAVGVLKIVAEYLSRLKSVGIYDQTTVIVMSDHGYIPHSTVEQSPLFLVKLAGASHPFDTSDLPLSYADLPEILVSALRGTLTSMDNWKADSPRYFYQARQNNSVMNITEYIINGPVRDVPAEKTGVVYHENTLHSTRDYTLGTTLYFDRRDTARRFCVSGISGNTGSRTWTNSNDAEMLFELPEIPGQLKLTMEYKPYNDEQTVDVWINDQLIETFTASGTTYHLTLIPTGTVTGKELKLRLHFPNARKPEGTNPAPRALSMNTLTISAVDP